MADDDRTVECEAHGTRTSCIVCCHLLRATDLTLGFVEDGDPNDPLAWCNDCERLYAREQDWTEAFKAFADLRVVCDACYAQLKELHSGGTIEPREPTSARRQFHSCDGEM